MYIRRRIVLGSCMAVVVLVVAAVSSRPVPDPQGQKRRLSSSPSRATAPGLAFAVTTPTSRPAQTEHELEPGRTVVHTVGGAPVRRRAFPGELPQMVERYVTGFGAIEPTLGIAPDGNAFFISGGNGKDLKPRVFRSGDDGVTWENVSPRRTPEEVPRVSGVDEAPNFTGDPYLHVDPVTGRVFSYNQDAYFFCDNWDVSPDGGATWRSWDTCGDQWSWGDHPTVTTGPPRASRTKGYPNVVYFCFGTGANRTECRTSLDGGKTYGEPAVALRKGAVGGSGHVTVAPDGTVYVPKLGGKAAWIAVSRDDGTSWRTTMVDDTAWTGPNVWHSPHEDVPEVDHDASVAVDEAGNVYFFWLGDDSLPYLATSRDRGRSWSKPVRVDAPGVTAARFPQIVAGGRGRVAFLYVGTTVPGGFEAGPSAMEAARWHGYVGFSLDALAERPVFATATANPMSDPLHIGDCAHRCLVDGGPGDTGLGQDGMFDFLDIDVSPATGRVWVALVDLCNAGCGRPDGTPQELGQYSMGAVGVQVRGPRL